MPMPAETAPAQEEMSGKPKAVTKVLEAPATVVPMTDRTHPSWLEDADPSSQNMYYGLYPVTLSDAWDFSIEAYNLGEPKEQYPFAKILPKGAAELRAKSAGTMFAGPGAAILPEIATEALEAGHGASTLTDAGRLILSKTTQLGGFKMTSMRILKEIKWTAELKGRMQGVKWLASGTSGETYSWDALPSMVEVYVSGPGFLYRTDDGFLMETFTSSKREVRETQTKKFTKGQEAVEDIPDIPERIIRTEGTPAVADQLIVNGGPTSGPPASPPVTRDAPPAPAPMEANCCKVCCPCCFSKGGFAGGRTAPTAGTAPMEAPPAQVAMDAPPAPAPMQAPPAQVAKDAPPAPAEVCCPCCFPKGGFAGGRTAPAAGAAPMEAPPAQVAKDAPPTPAEVCCPCCFPKGFLKAVQMAVHSTGGSAEPTSAAGGPTSYVIKGQAGTAGTETIIPGVKGQKGAAGTADVLEITVQKVYVVDPVPCWRLTLISKEPLHSHPTGRVEINNADMQAQNEQTPWVYVIDLSLENDASRIYSLMGSLRAIPTRKPCLVAGIPEVVTYTDDARVLQNTVKQKQQLSSYQVEQSNWAYWGSGQGRQDAPIVPRKEPEPEVAKAPDDAPEVAV